MTSESSWQTVTVTTEGAIPPAPDSAVAGKRQWKCPVNDGHIHREDVRKIWKECQEESFWYRAVPVSLGSMAVTGGLIYNGVWKASKRFGPFPKLAVAGILGYALGKASYAPTCRSKFKTLGLQDGPGFESGFGHGFGPWSRGGPPGPGHRACHHVCEECKQQAQAAPAEKV